jgi:serpin B
MRNIKRIGTLLVAASLSVPIAPAAQADAAEEDDQAVVHGNSAFAFDLYSELKGTEGNLFFSPFSVSVALAMTYAGARIGTEEQMARVLHFDLPQDRLHGAFSTLSDPSPDDGGSRLMVANALWAQEGYDFLDEFLALADEHYDGGFREVDFQGVTERARQTINEWIASQTEGTIEKLLHPGDLDPAVALVLTNAIFFKGTWLGRFEPRHTQDGPFRIDLENDVMVPMMHRTGRFAYAEEESLSVLELPYEGDRLAMVVLLPKTIDGLAELESSLSNENLDRWLARLMEQPVRMSLPRFGIDSRFDLAETLCGMGMTDAFSGRADFSGMTGRRDLFLSMVVHQAQLEVTEEGTEAAAGTAVVLKRGGPPATFMADHPFVFLIRDRQTGSILFIGRVENPIA